MAEVFISYSQKDRALVAPIAARLAELGVDAWYDREISAGERFGAVIRARLKEAKAVLACWSPEAIQSDWVEAEADYARELGTYVPVFVAPCTLMPPFNRIHTDDLSKWTGESNDPTWIKLVDRVAKVIGREGVAAAARALATGDEQTLYDFARRYPEEPTARKIWNSAEARYRERFKLRMAEARSAAEARINAERAALDARLREAAPTFEIWLADERRATAQGPTPDPLGLVEQAQPGEDRRLRDEIAALQNALALAKANAGERELEAANGKIARLSGELSALQSSLELATGSAHGKEKSADLDAKNKLIARLSGDLAAASAQAKSKDDDLNAAKAEIAKLSKELSAQLTAALKARGGTPELTALRARTGAPSASVRAAAVPATDERTALVRSASVSGWKWLPIAASVTGLLIIGLSTWRWWSAVPAPQFSPAAQAPPAAGAPPAAQVSPAAQALPAAQISPDSADAGKQRYLVVDTFSSRDDAEANLVEFDQHCGHYRSASRIVRSDELEGTAKGSWEVVLGPYPNTADLSQVWDGLRNCGSTPHVASGKRP
jgi:hypothetical protein